VRYQYDPVGRITNVYYHGGKSDVFKYDAAGNRIHEERTNLKGGKSKPISYKYALGNRLVKTNSETFSYDDQGNLVKKYSHEVPTTYTYDSKNRLAVVQLPNGSTVEYGYDFHGRRIHRKHGESVYHYLYDDRDLIAIFDGDMNAIIQTVHGLDIDEPLFYLRDGKAFYSIYDGLGNIVATMDDNANIISKSFTGAFGENESGDNKSDFIFSFQGRPFDPDTGLYFFRTRDYDPKTGRFLQPDPVQPDTNLNFYTFADNDPVNYRDPFGLSTEAKPIIVASTKYEFTREERDRIFKEASDAYKKNKAKSRAKRERQKELRNTKDYLKKLEKKGQKNTSEYERARNILRERQRAYDAAVQSFQEANKRFKAARLEKRKTESVVYIDIRLPIGTWIMKPYYNSKTSDLGVTFFQKDVYGTPKIKFKAGAASGNSPEGGEPKLSVQFPTPIGPVTLKGNTKTGEFESGGLSKGPASVKVNPETGEVDTKISKGIGPVKIAVKVDKYGNIIDAEYTVKPPLPIDVEYSVDDRERKVGATGVRLRDIVGLRGIPGGRGLKGLFDISKHLQNCTKRMEDSRK